MLEHQKSPTRDYFSLGVCQRGFVRRFAVRNRNWGFCGCRDGNGVRYRRLG